ncbi:MAG: hypothetical protein CL678_00700 [Bdellovibrionaceae bacterium]|nr:hypothetical protein [Pseudobdellovibrionaceae bacterium]
MDRFKRRKISHASAVSRQRPSRAPDVLSLIASPAPFKLCSTANTFDQTFWPKPSVPKEPFCINVSNVEPGLCTIFLSRATQTYFEFGEQSGMVETDFSSYKRTSAFDPLITFSFDERSGLDLGTNGRANRCYVPGRAHALDSKFQYHGFVHDRQARLVSSKVSNSDGVIVRIGSSIPLPQDGRWPVGLSGDNLLARIYLDHDVFVVPHPRGKVRKNITVGHRVIEILNVGIYQSDCRLYLSSPGRQVQQHRVDFRQEDLEKIQRSFLVYYRHPLDTIFFFVDNEFMGEVGPHSASNRIILNRLSGEGITRDRTKSIQPISADYKENEDFVLVPVSPPSNKPREPNKTVKVKIKNSKVALEEIVWTASQDRKLKYRNVNKFEVQKLVSGSPSPVSNVKAYVILGIEIQVKTLTDGDRTRAVPRGS